MSWYSADVRALSGEESYFASNDDLHKKTDAFKALVDALTEQGSKRLVELFVGAWESPNFQECPPLSEWYREIAKIAEQKNIQIEGLLSGTATSHEPIIKTRRVVSIDLKNVDDIDWVSDQDPGNTTIARRRVLSSDDDRNDDYVIPSSDLVKSRRKISHDTDKATPRAKEAATITPRKTSASQPTITSASSPKSRVSPTGSIKGISTTQKSSNVGEVLVNIFWTIVVIAVVAFVINLMFPDVCPSIIKFIQNIVDSASAQ